MKIVVQGRPLELYSLSYDTNFIISQIHVNAISWEYVCTARFMRCVKYWAIICSVQHQICFQIVKNHGTSYIVL